eukprot:1877783-Lingulodinium_polyedra.AAC.1
MVVDAWYARIAKCAPPQQWNALLSAFLSTSRGKLLNNAFRYAFGARCCAFRNSRAPCVNRRAAADAWNAR